MGLPQNPPSPSPSATAPSSSSPKPSVSATSLPPEALALATKLFDLARAGSTPELQQYLTAGIPPNLTNHKGDTLLMLAAYHGHAATVSMLLDAGADADVLNDRGQSPVAGAVFKGYGDVVRLLWESGADVAKGQPSAVEAAQMFRKVEYLEMFGITTEGTA